MSSPFDPQHAEVVNKIRYYARKYGIPENIGIWQLWQESRFNPRAVSHAGAKGIAQFMPATARRFNVDVYDVDSSLDGWGRYMRTLLGYSWINGNISFALAGYNAGEGNVKKYKGIPPFSETKNYVKIITENAGSTSNFLPVAQNPSGTNQTAGYLVLGLLAVVLITD